MLKITGYNRIVLSDMLDQIGEEETRSVLSNFSCPLNVDVENFLKKKAIEFSKQGISGTHLIFSSFKGKVELIAYFAISLKTLNIDKMSLSKSLKKRINKFATYNPPNAQYIIPAPLIGQLGKNFAQGLNSQITGNELLKMAIDEVKSCQKIMGGKVVYLECEDVPKLADFYSRNGFVNCGKRALDGDETDLKGEYLLQMMKYL